MMLEDTIECGDIAPYLRGAVSQRRADEDAAGLPCLLMHGAANGWLDFPPRHPAAMPGAYLDSLDAISPERAAWLGF